MEMADLAPIEDYIKKRKDTISAYVYTTEIFKMRKGTKALPRFSNQLLWWAKKMRKKDEEKMVIEISDDNESGNSLVGE